MSTVNPHYLKLSASYLFSEIAHRVDQYLAQNPGSRLIRLGIGDVTRPLPAASIEAMHRAVDELASADTFHGYGPEQGYGFLREAIVRHDFAPLGVNLSPDEVFVSDGAKSDTANIGELLDTPATIAVTDPVYPVYVDTNVMAGRAGEPCPDGRWSRITYLSSTAENGFVPDLPRRRPDLIYLCYPNNPTGTTLTRAELKRWVDYALENDSLIVFDAAYEAYITHPDIPHTIYEIPDAERVAVEIRSFSKTAGFTGVRCGYTVVPHGVTLSAPGGGRVSLNPLWNRRQTTKFNGASYIAQRGAEAVYTPEGRQQVRQAVGYYMENARLMLAALRSAGLEVYGGTDAPYLWLKAPGGQTSWQFFDHLLRCAGIVTTPGSGFGPSGEGYLRLTAFGKRDDCTEAMRRLQAGL